MGRMIIQAVAEEKSCEIVGGVEMKGLPVVGKDCGEVAGIGNIDAPIVDDVNSLVDRADVFIDFTFPGVTMKTLEAVKEAGKKMVIGTTALSKDEKAVIQEAGKKTAIVYSPNMSVGVNLLFEVIRQITPVLKDYDVEITEAHHRYKKDAPSGTAARLAEIVAQGLNRDLDKVGTYGRHGIVGERKKEEIGIHVIRAGDIVGDHTVLYCDEGERIEVKHQAHSRMTFAKGAVRAACFLSDQDKGFFTMKEVLGL